VAPSAFSYSVQCLCMSPVRQKWTDEGQELSDGLDNTGISERNRKYQGLLRVSLLVVPFKAKIPNRHEVLSCERTY
jgi:hypothetical protein